ncbi:MAG: carboxy-S-adenosyl-L-methionine synthase CmoA [Planctomycetaceae bacterium]|nr:carboxy-S-adenosyl-L-methionine synthase CmoA [Planctomycetaceae bacterium]
MKQDRIYATLREEVEPFVFDRQVVRVFDDMIQRSVPNYRELVQEIIELAVDAFQPETHLYDLGCSLGAVLIPVASRLASQPGTICGIDQSPAMLEELFQRGDGLPIELVCGDLRQMDFKPASVVILNLTLQFVPVEARYCLLARICDAMVHEGVLLLTEKISAPNAGLDQLYRERHHAFKRSQGYSDLEIHQKRQSLEDVMVTESKEVHLQRLADVGFSSVDVWHQRYNFASFYARK